MTAAPKAILFDLDETLLSFGDRLALLRDTALEFGDLFAPLTPAGVAEVMEATFVAFWADAEGHRVWRQAPLVESRREIARRGFAALAARGVGGLGDDQAVEFADRFHTRREAGLAFFPGALETLDALRARGVRLALVTNGASDVQRRKIERFDLAHRFEHIQIEGEHGFGKPEPRAYRHALAALNASPSEAWMVGDNLDWEVVAPQRLGITGIWHDPQGRGLPQDSLARPDRIIRALPELLD